MRRFRESKLGRFITQQDATAHPDTTQAETVSAEPHEVAALKWRLADCEAEMLNAASALTLVERPTTKTLKMVAAELERVARDRIPEEDK